MRISELVDADWREQVRILRRGLPTKALRECAELVEVSPTKLAKILHITRKPKRRYSVRAGEKIWRVADLRSHISRELGDTQANVFLKKPCSELKGRSPLEVADLWIGACVVRQILAQRASSKPTGYIVK